MAIDLNGCTANEKVANTFNAFFLTIGENLKKKIEPLNPSEGIDLNNRINNCTNTNVGNHNLTGQQGDTHLKSRFRFRKTNTLELMHLVNKIQVHKASGVERISSYLLKLCFKSTLEQLAFLINLIISCNNIPKQWKSAIVTPIFKADDPRTPGNYRPISTLPLQSSP